jgi:hypothetical protein
MKQLLLILLFILPFTINSQIYNSTDTTWTVTYNQVLKIRESIESCKNNREVLEKEIDLLELSGQTKDLTIKKLLIRDSLYSIELSKYKEMDDIMRNKVFLSNDIINNYKVLLMSTEDSLKIETKAKRKEKIWKNIYKYGYAVGGVLVGILILR